MIREEEPGKRDRVANEWHKLMTRLQPRMEAIMPPEKRANYEVPCDAMECYQMTMQQLRWEGRWTNKQIDLIGDLVEIVLDQFVNLAEPLLLIDKAG